MATIGTHATVLTLFFSFLSSLPKTAHCKFSEQSPETKVNQHLTEKTTHLRFYFHDIPSGKHPTAIWVAGKKNKFTATAVMDDPLTEGADPASKEVGRAQGMYSVSSQDLKSLLMVMNFVFSEGKYNGSSLSILGRNAFLESVTEMPIVGGTGLFRFARGYVLARTESYNIRTGDAVVEYNVFVMHF